MSDETRSGDKETVFIVNGASRSGSQMADASRNALIEAGFTVTESLVTTKPNEMSTQLKAWVQSKVPLVIVGGGDGTQREAAEIISGSETTLGVFPLGTGNAWAKDLGIPVPAPEAAKVLFNANVETIDLGVANKRGFVNVATIGLTSLIVKNIPTQFKGRFGKLVYLPAVIRSLAEMKPFYLNVETDGDSYAGEALLFVAAAGRTHAGPFRVTRFSSNNDGLLSLYALDATDRMGMAKFALGLLTGLHTFLSEVWNCETKSTQVKTDPEKRIIVDGEPSGRTPLALEIRPASLRVLVPQVDEQKEPES